MDKKLKKDFQKKIIRNRDAPEKNIDSKLVHSDDYTNKIIKTKDRFGDKISEKESKLIQENVHKVCRITRMEDRNFRVF